MSHMHGHILPSHSNVVKLVFCYIFLYLLVSVCVCVFPSYNFTTMPVAFHIVFFFFDFFFFVEFFSSCMRPCVLIFCYPLYLLDLSTTKISLMCSLPYQTTSNHPIVKPGLRTIQVGSNLEAFFARFCYTHP